MLIPFLLASAAAAAVPPTLKQVIVVHKTHFDIGYTELARDVVTRYRTTMIDKALDVMDMSRALPPEQRFIWTVPGWPMSQILWDGQEPARRERVLRAFRSGQFAVHALPFTTHTESLDLEDLVRGLGFSSRLARMAAIELPRDAKMTDVPSHSWVLPTLLKHAGVEFLHLGSNRMSSNPDLRPRFGIDPEHPEWYGHSLFWWEGPDGSRLLTMYSRAYGSTLAPPPDWPYQTWLAMIHTGDNAGPPTPEAVRKLIDSAAAEMPGVKVRFGRLSDFADAILAEKPDLPVIRADMPDTWIHGIGSLPAETAAARIERPRTAALEALNTLLRAWGAGAAEESATVAAAWEQTLLYGEHTWGFDAKKFPRLYGDEWRQARAEGKFKRLEESWAEHGGYARRAVELVEPKLREQLETLARSVRAKGKRVVVFNALAWERGGVVEIDAAGPCPAALRDGVTGAVIAVEKTAAGCRFVATAVAPMGYRTYLWADAAGPDSALRSDDTAGVIENEFYRVRLDPAAGRIVSIIDKPSGREFVDSTADAGFGQYLAERFSAADMTRFVETYTKPIISATWGDFGKPGLPAGPPYRLTATRGMRLELRRSAVSVSAVMTAPAGALEVTLYAGRPSLDIAWRIAAKQADPWPEAGWLAFPLRVQDPEFRFARLGAVVDPARDTVRGVNHDVYCLNGGVAVLQRDRSGVALCPLDSPLVSLDRPGLWHYSKEFFARRPYVFLNVFNNVWGTNFAQWSEGRWSSRVRLWTIDAWKDAATLTEPSSEARSPLLGAIADGPAGSLPPAQTGPRIPAPGVIVTAFGRNPDGPGTILRLWEQAGVDRSCEVCLPAAMNVRSASPVDLRGRAAGPALRPANGCFKVSLRHYAPVSYVLTP